MLVCQACIARPDLPDDPVTLDAVRAFSFVFSQTAERVSGVRRTDVAPYEQCLLTAGDNCDCT